ncbi:unnamed protein product [Periconia digitata]|uniref:Uncharacterized protein n=1 Tax=Periconia digitata TaxID=1303443 RepID=A0A9W4TZY0_9PLEO|nr:unnamed protein product [Periconia digitata]
MGNCLTKSPPSYDHYEETPPPRLVPAPRNSDTNRPVARLPYEQQIQMSSRQSSRHTFSPPSAPPQPQQKAPKEPPRQLPTDQAWIADMRLKMEEQQDALRRRNFYRNGIRDQRANASTKSILPHHWDFDLESETDEEKLRNFLWEHTEIGREDRRRYEPRGSEENGCGGKGR